MKVMAFWMLLFTFTLQALTLSPHDRSLLQNHPLRCVTTTQWAPFNHLENGKLTGIGIDYWHLIQKKLHIQGDCTITKHWTAVLDAIKNHTADLTIAAQRTSSRLPYAAFSKPYASYPIVIVTRNDVGFVDTIDLLHKKRIVGGKNYASTEIVQKKSSKSTYH